MNKAKFILSKDKLLEKLKSLENLGLKISYSYKTNREVGKVLQEINDCDFSIHAKQEVEDIVERDRIWFFLQAESVDELNEILGNGVKNFVVDNEVDLQRLLEAVKKKQTKIVLSLRMKFKENRIGSGKYFVYGMSSKKVNELILRLKDSEFINKLGIHIHRKSQNTSEWEIRDELKDSLSPEALKILGFLNFGGGLPIKYRNYTSNVLDYVFSKIKEAVDWLKEKGIESYIEPGRFLAGSCIKLETQIIQVQNKNIILNTTIYNTALDTVITQTKLLIEQEQSEDQQGDYYLIKGNSPTRDDIFRYKVKLKDPKVGDTITFLNAGAYNYTTDFFGYKKLETEIREETIQTKSIIQVPSSQGDFGNNKSCSKTPDILVPEAEKLKLPENNIEETNQILENQKADIFVGGDHSITYPLFKTFAKQYKSQYNTPCLVVFDAHVDCSDNFMPPTHEDFNRVLIEQKILKPENLLIIGVRKIYNNEQKFINKHNIKVIKQNQIKDTKTLIQQIKEFTKNKNLYLSIDIDVLDPQEAPGTYYKEENGMKFGDLLNVLKGVKEDVKRADLVEINPELDIDNKTIEIGKKIIGVLKNGI